jgi:leucyl-tRNA synthetase
MVLVREIESLQTIAKKTYSELLVLLAPFAPHTTESLWDKLDLEGSVHQSLWVTTENEKDEEFATVVVQINSKKRGQISVQKEATETEALTLAKEIPEVAKKLADSETVRIVYVKGRILNIVIEN